MTTTAFSNETSAPAPRLALITGANRGIGRATALALARDGVDVIITYRSHADEADEVVAGIGELGRKAVAFQLDPGEVSSFEAFVAEVTDALHRTWSRGTFDWLINNAGMQITASFPDATEEGFDRMVDVHLKGVFFLPAHRGLRRDAPLAKGPPTMTGQFENKTAPITGGGTVARQAPDETVALIQSAGGTARSIFRQRHDGEHE
jgi:NAD(P)-dependent dehydrogenase (short-subunit alcohol dehydrogenase family)